MFHNMFFILKLSSMSHVSNLTCEYFDTFILTVWFVMFGCDILLRLGSIFQLLETASKSLLYHKVNIPFSPFH